MPTQEEREAQKLYAKFLTEAQRGRKPALEEYVCQCPASEAERLRDALIGVEASIRSRWSVVAPDSVIRAVRALQARAERRKVLDHAQARLKEIVARGAVARPDEVLGLCLGLPHGAVGTDSPPAYRAFARGEFAAASKTHIDRFWLKIKEPQIKSFAQDVLREAGIDAAPVDLGGVTQALSLAMAEAELQEELEGCLVTDGVIGGILVNTLVTNTRRRRYTWAHEIGHFVLHKDRRVFKDSRETVNDTGGSAVETEANIFASMLLLPDALLPPGMLGGKPVFSDADELADRFNVSLEACLRRLVRASDWPCALVVSKDGIVERVVPADLFQGFIAIKQRVKIGTVAEGLDSTDAGKRGAAEMPAGFWINGWSTSWDAQLVREETRVLRAGFMYTILTLIERTR